MFDRLMDAAARCGVRQITGVYRPTGKNGLVADLYEKLGFRKTVETSGETRYTIATPEKPSLTATHIRNVSTAVEATA